MGADDYIAKPFSQRLLIARIRAVLRRTEMRARPPDESRGRRGGGDRARPAERWTRPATGSAGTAAT